MVGRPPVNCGSGCSPRTAGGVWWLVVTGCGGYAPTIFARLHLSCRTAEARSWCHAARSGLSESGCGLVLGFVLAEAPRFLHLIASACKSKRLYFSFGVLQRGYRCWRLEQ